MSDTKMAFHGSGVSGQSGIYVRSISGGPITTIADTNTTVPAGTGNFAPFNTEEIVAISGSTVAFRGNFGNNQRGIYTASVDGGSLTKVIATGDVLEGRTVSSLAFGKSGLDGSILVFHATFTDGSQAVYTFTPVPEPTGMLALSAAAAVGTLGLGRWMLGGF